MTPSDHPESMVNAIHSMNILRYTCLFARLGVQAHSKGALQWMTGLTDDQVQKLEANDFYKGNVEVTRSYVEAVTPADVFRFEFLQLMIIMETFIANLVRQAIASTSPPDLEIALEKCLKGGFGKQLKVIDRIAHFSQLELFPKYKEARARRNSLVHSDGIVTNAYLKDGGTEAHGTLGDSLLIDEKYVDDTCHMLVSLMALTGNEIIARRHGECCHSRKIYSLDEPGCSSSDKS